MRATLGYNIELLSCPRKAPKAFVPVESKEQICNLFLIRRFAAPSAANVVDYFSYSKQTADLPPWVRFAAASTT